MGDIFEDIAERVATARTRALMGERREALAILQRARMDYMRFQEVLHDYPGSLALARSLEAARAALDAERSRETAKQHERQKGKRKKPSSKRSKRAA